MPLCITTRNITRRTLTHISNNRPRFTNTTRSIHSLKQLTLRPNRRNPSKDKPESKKTSKKYPKPRYKVLNKDLLQCETTSNNDSAENSKFIFK
jgi:hypothetical protein